MGWGPWEYLDWSKWISLGQCRFRFGHLWGMFDTGKMPPICKLHRNRVSHKDDGCCPSNPPLEAIQLRFSLLSLVPANCCPFSRAKGECFRDSKSLCGLFKRSLGFQQPSVLPGWSELLWIFMARFCAGFSSKHWNFVLESPSLGLGFLAPPMVPPQQRFPAPYCHMQVQGQAILCLCLFYQFQCGLFIISLFIRVLFN